MIKNKFKELDLDILLTDCLTPSGQRVADDLGLQCIVNIPGALGFNIGNFATLNAKNIGNFMGLTIVAPSVFNFIFRKVLTGMFGKMFSE